MAYHILPHVPGKLGYPVFSAWMESVLPLRQLMLL